MARRRPGTQETIIEVDGVFDVPAAKRVAAVIERARPGESVHVDAARVSRFEDFGLALLAQALGQTSAARVAVRGLRDHQLRILRYFGVDPARLRLRAPALELELSSAAAAVAE